MHRRMMRERRTIEKMIALYCHLKHGTAKGEYCVGCRELLEYAFLRLSRCPFQEGKTTCGNCKIHCYKPEMRKKIREVMGFSGPKMLFHHPVLAVHHIIDGLRKKAVVKKKKQ